ncbi:hypothetical protein MMC16_000175 [Acarospora aff. strigata]|nr:hypothetical protein [Acarospora aff. strigata]
MSIASVEPNWPPRSPHEVLLSSPSGRRKLAQFQDRTSPTPSPLKRSNANPSLRRKAPLTLEAALGPDDIEEDEETLQLQLQRIEAKLKIKKLQAKSRAAEGGESTKKGGGALLQSPKRANSALSSRADQNREGRDRPIQRSKSQADLQIPVSPPRKRIVAEEPLSPGRVLLGIDKGLKGRDVSLRRAPSLRDDNSRHQDPFGGHLRPQSSRSSVHGSVQSMGGSVVETQAKSKTFSERMAEIRAHDKVEKKRADEMRRKRSKGFGVDDKELVELKKKADLLPAVPSSKRPPTSLSKEREFSREEVLKALNKPASGLTHRDTTASSVRNTRRIYEQISASTDSTQGTSKRTMAPETSRSLSPVTKPKPSSSPSVDAETEVSNPFLPPDPALFDSYSALHLSKRMLPEDFLARTLTDKHIFLIPDLLKTIKAPEYQAPDVEGDFVVLGIVASKSAPRDHKETHKTSKSKDADPDNGRSKYMVITLTDLKWELSLYLFTTAFDRFWKLTPGTLIAILNPHVMPPRAADIDTGRFSLVLNSSDDTVLGIGMARDLGFCKSVKRDGKVCDSWVDRQHTEFCTFHVDKQIARTKAGRMEVNTMSAPFAPGGRGSSRTGFFGTGRSGRRGGANNNTKDREKFKDDGLRKEGAQYDRLSSTRYFIAPPTTHPGRSAAALLDDEDHLNNNRNGASKEDRLRKHLAAREKERDIARRLGQGGNGIGQEYLRLATTGTASSASAGAGAAGDGNDTGGGPTQDDNGLPAPPDAGALGLLGNRAEMVSLSPTKLKVGVKGLGARRKGKRKREDGGVDLAWAQMPKLGWGRARGVGVARGDDEGGENVEGEGGGGAGGGGGGGGGGGEKSPSPKKTRFVTARGIREAGGRESSGVGVGAGIRGLGEGDVDADADDGLDII